MKTLVLTLAVLALCAASVAQSLSLKKVSLQQETAVVAAREGGAQAQPVATSCPFTFTSGSNNTYLSYCVTQNGNVLYITTPVGRGQSGTDEGYGWCDTSSATSYFDYGPRFGDSGNWNPAVLVSQTATLVKIEHHVRWPLDADPDHHSSGINLVHKGRDDSQEQQLRSQGGPHCPLCVCHPRRLAVRQLRQDAEQCVCVEFHWLGDASLRLVLQNVGTSPFFGYNGFAQNTASPPNPCDYTANWTGGLATNINGSLVMV